MGSSIKKVSDQNARFWDELCGSQLAEYLGVKDSSVSSLKRFDDWYFGFYPYLNQHISFDSLNGKRVLEAGLGYGTVSQRLAESGAIYSGLDIAEGPVRMVNQRLLQNQLSGKAVQGSILEPPFEGNSFDAIIAIGCLHHTGDLQLAIQQCWNLLRPGGRMTFMIYYAYSYRRWMQAKQDTFRYFMQELVGKRSVVGATRSDQRGAYDKNLSGDDAPHTDWISIKSVKTYCSKFQAINTHVENIDIDIISIPFLKIRSRDQLLQTKIPSVCGLDLYVTVTK